ncbi:2OG-Fe(II) oxygenase [Aliiglaciecola sp. CAU 1673]|uniref:2OG-Fe(II) oxygenase n=1 Tax=Aliiglaciecola sp. CAU 1673 TaxID=3032595 RepID=UPI0023DBC9F8|nr:2OG-Fe(II) oxygenase [Aliiglaciecola sp. CAU 1673]MDF2179152.1 2OG-Fe(II) oxygenase [Aliiglaciecola sp. CAU 1673]
MSQFIEVIDDALPLELCQSLIRQFEQSPNRAPGQTSGGVDLDKKRSLDVQITRAPEFQTLLPQVLQTTGKHLMDYFAKYYFALIGPIGLTIKHPQTGQPVKLTQNNFEELGRPNLQNFVQYLFRLGDINAQKYPKGEGGYPYWHSEVYPQQGHNDALHRMLLFMFYLNDVEEGGETDFYYQDLSIKPEAGRMVIAPAYFTHTHRGNIPKSGDKYILTSWVLFNRAEQIYT